VKAVLVSVSLATLARSALVVVDDLPPSSFEHPTRATATKTTAKARIRRAW
jgi:hypothetical protein